jgi:hypothetical protein
MSRVEAEVREAAVLESSVCSAGTILRSRMETSYQRLLRSSHARIYDHVWLGSCPT